MNLEECYTSLLKCIEPEKINREGLKNTPERAARALRFLTKGYDENLDEIINGAIFQSEMDEMVTVKDIEFYSLCEHHLLPFFGKCHVAYIPNGKIIGLSKVARIVEHFARRLQVQEHLTQDIAECIATLTEAKGVGVVMEAQHLCMMMRGVEKQSAFMKTSKMIGHLKLDASLRSEFFNLVQA